MRLNNGIAHKSGKAGYRMIQYLNRLKSKKGFTMVELIVVVGIIAILITVIGVGSLSGSTERQLAANSNAEAFFSACQLTFTRAQLTERSIVTYEADKVPIICYKDGKNSLMDSEGSNASPAPATYLFLEAKSTEKGFEWLHVSTYFDTLMSKAEDLGMTALESYLMKNLKEYMADSYDGYFYAMIDSDFKVTFTHFTEVRLPVYTAGESTSDFVKSMQTYEGKVMGSHGILGVCSDEYAMADSTTYVFSIPMASDDVNRGKYYKNYVEAAPATP